MAISGPRPQLEETREPELFRLRHPDMPEWKNVIDRSVRQPQARRGDALSPVRQIAFGPAPFIERLGDLDVFKIRSDALLMHLAHPMMKRALGMLTRRRYPGEGGVSRWTGSAGWGVAGRRSANSAEHRRARCERTQESFHHWVRTVGFAIRGGRIGSPLMDLSQGELGSGRGTTKSADWDHARDLLGDADRDLRRWCAHVRTTSQSACAVN